MQAGVVPGRGKGMQGLWKVPCATWVLTQQHPGHNRVLSYGLERTRMWPFPCGFGDGGLQSIAICGFCHRRPSALADPEAPSRTQRGDVSFYRRRAACIGTRHATGVTG